MKPFVFPTFSVILILPFLSAFSAEVDPRITSALRAELSTAQAFCFSFARDGVRNGTAVAQTCLTFAADRHYGNTALAEKKDDIAQTGDIISNAQAEFCAAVGTYTSPGGWTRADCDAWNRERAALFKLSTTPDASRAALSAGIESTEKNRRRFCQSLLAAGNPGDPSVFAARISRCFSLVTLATSADRAILLGDFSTDLSF